MEPKIVLATLVICAVILKTDSDKNCGYRLPDYTRVKRAKYYSNPPIKFYRRPPMSYPVKGAFSYTPPPNYMKDDDEQYPPYLRPQKVSKRPTNDGLAEDDINNLVKYLSKKDLDKIIEFSGETERNIIKHGEDTLMISRRPLKRESMEIYKATVQESDADETFSLNGPYIRANQNEQPYKIEYNNPNINYVQDATRPKALYSNPPEFPKIIDSFVRNTNKDNTQWKVMYTSPSDNHNFHNPRTNDARNPLESSNTVSYNAASNIPLNTEESLRNYQISFINNKETYKVASNGNIYTDDSIMKEELLPRPVNLRDEEEYEASFTNVKPIVVADDGSYEVEGFGDLPLMNYHNSKLHSVSSYHVPHYTVTSSTKNHLPPPSAPSSAEAMPELEVAPPGYDGRDQSDAHLKAIKIWTHRSKGTAYTLHKDGTLSLERPGRIKSYGHP